MLYLAETIQHYNKVPSNKATEKITARKTQTIVIGPKLNLHRDLKTNPKMDDFKTKKKL